LQKYHDQDLTLDHLAEIRKQNTLEETEEPEPEPKERRRTIKIFINCNWGFTRWQWLIYINTIATKFTSGEPHEKHAVATLESWELFQHLLLDTGKPRKTCAEVAGRRTFRILTASQQSGI
jgi:hypothetical protein